MWFTRDAERTRLAYELAGLRAEIKLLRTEKDRTEQVRTLERDIQRLTIEKDKLAEDNDRKVKRAEFDAGLLIERQEHEVANARRETELKVREENLDADKTRFQAEMDFRELHMTREMDRFEGFVKDLMARLPDIQVALTGRAGGKERSSAS